MKDLDKLQDLKSQALALMKNAGFELKDEISVELDHELPFMGYTTEKDGKIVIVVAGFAMEGDKALNLLIHEMSHVYRTQTGHPSHNQQQLLAITAWVMHGRAVHGYQEKILHAIINNLQDLYADDISFKIFKKHENLNEFFMGWIKTPVIAKMTEDKWDNAEKLLSAAFAQGNLERHGVKDTGEKVQKAIETFLAHTDKRIVGKYAFFKNLMVEMPEEITNKEFETLLLRYISEFLKLTTI